MLPLVPLNEFHKDIKLYYYASTKVYMDLNENVQPTLILIFTDFPPFKSNIQLMITLVFHICVIHSNSLSRSSKRLAFFKAVQYSS